jgi:hypothetical protein
LSLRTVIGPRTGRSSSPIPSGACAVKKARCSLEYSLRIARLPAANAVTVERRSESGTVSFNSTLSALVVSASSCSSWASESRRGRCLVAGIVRSFPGRWSSASELAVSRRTQVLRARTGAATNGLPTGAGPASPSLGEFSPDEAAGRLWVMAPADGGQGRGCAAGPRDRSRAWPHGPWRGRPTSWHSGRRPARRSARGPEPAQNPTVTRRMPCSWPSPQMAYAYRVDSPVDAVDGIG